MNIRGGTFTIPFNNEGYFHEVTEINLNQEAGLFWIVLEDRTQINIPVSLVKVLYDRLAIKNHEPSKDFSSTRSTSIG